MKKSMIQLALIKPDVKGLEDEEIEPPPKESKGERGGRRGKRERERER